MAKFYITTAIPYVNASPHIGHALEIIQADVIARYERLLEKEVFFLTGTDDNGLKNYQTAQKAGKTAQEFVDANSGIFRSLAEKLNISNDDFIRTSDQERHWPVAQKIWLQLKNSGDIYKKAYRGFYCVGHEYFHPENELVNGECPDYPGRPLELIEEENYFFRLSKYSSNLREIISNGQLKIIPGHRQNEILALIDRGLEDVSFSRPAAKLPWGVPVPDDPEQVMYVWCDALTNYLSGVNYAEAGIKFQKFWPPDLQIIGKDILRFHAAIWPAMLISAGLPLPKALLAHGFVTSSGQKMSKSLGNVVDPFQLIDDFGADAVRYFLAREISTTEDGDFSEEKFSARYNGDLANGLGNLLSRVLALGEKFGREINLKNDDSANETQEIWKCYDDAMLHHQLHEALSAVWDLIHKTDLYLNQKEPWKLLGKDNAESSIGELENIFSSVVIFLANIGWMLKPFLPETAGKIIDALGLDHGRKEPWKERKVMLKKSGALFPRKDFAKEK